MLFRDREEAGRLLAQKLKKKIKKKEFENFVVVAVARGGVVLGRIIADYFNIPLSVLVIKKMGAPNNPELAIGAVGPKKTVWWDEDLVKSLSVGRKYQKEILKEKEEEVKVLGKILKDNGNKLNFKDKKVIVVDDGIATGTTVLCASKFLRSAMVSSIILATPLIAKETLNSISSYFDMVIALQIPQDFSAVGQFYEDFPQVEDNEVIGLLKR